MRTQFKTIGKAASRALVDLAALLTLFPILAISFTWYRVTLLVAAYMLRNFTCNAEDIADKVNALYAYVRDEGWEGLKSRVKAAIERVKSTLGRAIQKLRGWSEELTIGLAHRLTHLADAA